MNWNKWMRESHRWVSMAFTLTVVINFVAMAVAEAPPLWLNYLPLPPLFLLLITGLYLFALPYLAKRRAS